MDWRTREGARRMSQGSGEATIVPEWGLHGHFKRYQMTRRGYRGTCERFRGINSILQGSRTYENGTMELIGDIEQQGPSP